MKEILSFALLFVIYLSTPSNVCAQSNDIQIANEYFKSSEFEKARDQYEKALRDDKAIPLVHKNYLATLEALRETKSIERYLKGLIKNYPENVYYKVDFGNNLKKQKGDGEAGKYFNKMISELSRDESKARIAANYLIELRELDLAEKLYLETRKRLQIKNLFAYELANIYMFTQNFSKILEELIGFSYGNPSGLEIVKNSLQSLLRKEEDYLKLEKILIASIQSNPQDYMYSELLLWLYVQQKQFYKAFIQARSLDKRLKGDGERLLELGLIAFQNKAYEDALVVFQYIIDNYSKSLNYVIAKNYLINSKEEIIKNTYPLDYDKIKSLINDYSSLIKEVGISASTVESMRNMALLYAFYYEKRDTAIVILERTKKIPQLPISTLSKLKIDLGDIYLLNGEPWEATLFYSQVEKAEKDKPLGYEAKLKNAKLSYYKGDFKLAQAHLDVLKLATSREIANDAMDLSLLIQDNTGLDSTEQAMKEYAKVDLLLFQNKKNEALKRLNELETEYKDHSILDEIIFLKAKVYQEVGDVENAILNYELIVKNHGQDIYGDDALYFEANLYEESKKDSVKALELYTNHLKIYPGSIFTSEVRKKIRRLRGDVVN